MAKQQNKIIIDYKKMVSRCSQGGLWQPKVKARAFIMINVPVSVLGCIRGDNLGSASCADYSRDALTIVMDDDFDISSYKNRITLYKKISFVIKLSKVGKLFDTKVDITKDGRFVASAIRMHNMHIKRAA